MVQARADMSTDHLVLLGTKGGPAIRKGGPNPSASLLVAGGRAYVIDCGLGVTRGLVEAGVPLATLSTIFLTHHHSDHNLEFGPLLLTAWMAGLSTPVAAHGAPGLAALAKGFFASQAFDIEIRMEDEGRPDPRALLSIHEFGEGLVMDDGNVRVTALRVDHPPIRDCFALRFDFGGRAVVFSADTAYFPPLADFARGADILVHEAMYLPGVDALVKRVANGARLKEHLVASHTTAEDVGRIATAAGVKHLVINHMVPADDPAITPAHWEAAIRATWDGPLSIGLDGARIALA
jgi:ribonuclease BN (tRNA processing enzyme)